MSLDEFKSIYYWEYFHRLLGRLIGVAFAVPFIWFLARRQLPRRLAPPLAGILLLGFVQGALGWYMVESGLADRVEVSQYRLVAHLALALAIYAAILWMALGIVRGSPAAGFEPRLAAGRRSRACAGRADHPCRRLCRRHPRRADLQHLPADGRQAGAGRLCAAEPFWLNWFENIAAVQFDHRALAITTAAAIVLLWAAGLRANLPKPARTALHALLARRAVAGGARHFDLAARRADPARRGASGRGRGAADRAILLRHTLRRPIVMDGAVAAPI